MGDQLSPRRVNHVAYPTTDSAATYRFYTEVLGCRLVAAVREEEVPSTGAKTPFLHTFFAMHDGTCLAFFEVDGMGPPADDGIPSWVRHIAMDVESMAQLEAWKEQLRAHGVDFIGTVDHEGIWYSIYFFDPNGIRLELTHQARPLTGTDASEGEQLLRTWAAQRGQSLTSGEPAAAR